MNKVKVRIQIFSDIHGDIASLDRAVTVDADIYIAAGDLVTWPAPLAPCGATLAPLGERLWVMPGNNETADQVREFCARHGFRPFHDAAFRVGETYIVGMGYSNPTPFDTPGEYTEHELAERLAKFASLSPQVLVSHAPPADTALDEAAPGLHFGSMAVRNYIDTHQPGYCFCGHIHEGEGRLVHLGNTVACNVGKRGYLLEL